MIEKRQTWQSNDPTSLLTQQKEQDINFTVKTFSLTHKELSFHEILADSPLSASMHSLYLGNSQILRDFNGPSDMAAALAMLGSKTGNLLVQELRIEPKESLATTARS